MEPSCALAFATGILLSFWVISGDQINIDAEEIQTFIVRVQNELKPSVFPDVVDWYSSTLESLSSYPLDSGMSETTQRRKKRDFVYVYKTVFHGFSARLKTQQAQELAKRPEVLGVIPDRVRQIQTTRSPEFLGLAPNNPTNLLPESDSGSNVIIGVIDTGIWPERRSFHDEGLGPVPRHWKGDCTEGERFTKASCNKKIIGARYFTNGYEASMGSINQTADIKSARDNDGHGTHTASTAAGRKVANASFFGLAQGVAMGIAPKARIAAYKVCWSSGCLDSDILAAFDKAVEDGVNVISLSMGGDADIGVRYNMDPFAIGSFAAMDRGIFVSAAAGNSGATHGSVINVAPWITTVGASTIDRKFPADLLLENGTVPTVITGSSLYVGRPLPKKTYLPIIYAAVASKGNVGTCSPDSLDKNLVRGKIVVCDIGEVPRVAKGQTVKDAGGLGLILQNGISQGDGLIADPHIIPGMSITESASDTLATYMTSSKHPRATMVFRGTQVGVKPAPVVATFSSRGPSSESAYLLKPDVIAPGVDILAAWPDSVAPSRLPSDPRRTEFNIISGTSMSCPHVSGVAALLKGAHPDWSPAAIRSALMTTAYVHDREGKPLLDEYHFEADAWGTGAGHVDPEKAVDPGLLYDLTVDDYLNFLCASGYNSDEIKQITRKSVSCKGGKYKPWELNYPAISVGPEELISKTEVEVAVTRTATHVGDGASSYSVTVTPPGGVKVTVDPLKMEFKEKGEKKSYVVRISAEKNKGYEWGVDSGQLTWTDGKHQVTTPIVAQWTLY